MPERTNIVFITSDQQRADCYGFAGRRVRTPHLDRLVAEGTHFDRCITPNLVCQPSRASMLTGLLPLSHGVVDNGIDLRPETAARGFAETLTRRGYDTAFLGKAHFATCNTFARTGTPECVHSSAEYGPDWFGPYMGFRHVELMVLGHWFHGRKHGITPPRGQHFERWVFEETGFADVFELWAAETWPGAGAAQTWSSAMPPALHSSTWCADRTVDWLRGRTAETPFCVWVSFPDPHHPFDCPEPWSRLHHPDEVDLPVEGARDLDRRPWWHRASLENEPALDDPSMRSFRANLSRVPDQTEAQLREMIANYYGMVSLIDHSVGRILAEIDRLGLRENTLVVYSTDHGDLLGDHGLYLKGPTPYEALLRVGLIARGPGVAAGRTVREPVSTVDLAQTFCDYAGTALGTEVQSRSLRDLLEGHSGASRDAAYSEWNVDASRCGVPLDLRTVRTADAKLTLELNSGAGELYHLGDDPHEMHDRFGDPGIAVLQRELEDMIRARPGSELNAFDPAVGMA